jgi:hypothetical protein
MREQLNQPASTEGSLNADNTHLNENSNCLNTGSNGPREIRLAPSSHQDTNMHPLGSQDTSLNPQREERRRPTVLSPSETDPDSLGRVQEQNDDDRILSPEPTVEGREMQVYGATSLLHDHSSEALLANSQLKGNEEDTLLKRATQDRLISHAAIGRQREAILYSAPSVAANIDFDGVPMDIAMHLLDLHWNRQHFLYLLTYRPAIMDSLVNNGPYVNKLLLNAIYLQGSLDSDRTSLRLDPQDPQTTGMAFYDRFKASLVHYIDKPTMPTVVALLTCGACLVPHGKQSAG